jgi:hypothetical protein
VVKSDSAQGAAGYPVGSNRGKTAPEHHRYNGQGHGSHRDDDGCSHSKSSDSDDLVNETRKGQ